MRRIIRKGHELAKQGVGWNHTSFTAPEKEAHPGRRKAPHCHRQIWIGGLKKIGGQWPPLQGKSPSRQT